MIYTGEAVSFCHPDKICDIISDAIVDACLEQDPKSRVAVECVGGHGYVYLVGEITTKAEVNYQYIAKKTYANLTGKKIKVVENIVSQSPNIAQGVNKGGAGDQGIMVGYACNENELYIPQEMYVARDLLKPFKVDAKSQVTINNGQITDIVLSVQGKTKEELENYLSPYLMADYYCNYTGAFTIGGFDADSGCTGRKIVVDAYGPRVPVGGGAFCVDGNTEFLSPIGWKKISEYKNELVGQYNNGRLEFVKPDEYINEDCDELYHVETTGIDMMLSGGHRFVYLSSKGNINIKPFYKVKEQHEKSESGFRGSIITHFKNDGGIGIDISDDELRLRIAMMADGCFKGNRCRFRLKKKRKIKRLLDLLDSLGRPCNYYVLDDGFTYITVFDVNYKSKVFDYIWWQADKKQLEIIADEVCEWDGDPDKKIYRTTIKENADFVQYVFTSISNTRSSISIDDRIGEKYRKKYKRKSICYEVGFGKWKHLSLRRTKKPKIEIKTVKKDKQYCFTVPSGMLVLRRNNNIFITGNSGKDPTKVDRSAAYMARFIALQYLHEYNAKEVLVKLAYCIGKRKPVMQRAIIDGMEGDIPDYDCRPEAIIERFDLRRPIYEDLAKNGHFGRKNLPWEQYESNNTL